MNAAPYEHEWRTGRCKCCYKKTSIVLGVLLNETVSGWDNVMSAERAAVLAKAGTCPWCGRTTTIVGRTLMQRFEPMLRRYAREIFVT